MVIMCTVRVIQSGVLCIFVNGSNQDFQISTKTTPALRGMRSSAFCRLLHTSSFHPKLDFTLKIISSLAMMEHQPSLDSQLRTICALLRPSRDDLSSSARLLESVVQTLRTRKAEESHRKPIWTPSGLGKQSQILHGAVEPGLGSHPPSQKSQAMAQDTK